MRMPPGPPSQYRSRWCFAMGGPGVADAGQAQPTPPHARDVVPPEHRDRHVPRPLHADRAARRLGLGKPDGNLDPRVVAAHVLVGPRLHQPREVGHGPEHASACGCTGHRVLHGGYLAVDGVGGRADCSKHLGHAPGELRNDQPKLTGAQHGKPSRFRVGLVSDDRQRRLPLDGRDSAGWRFTSVDRFEKDLAVRILTGRVEGQVRLIQDGQLAGGLELEVPCLLQLPEQSDTKKHAGLARSERVGAERSFARRHRRTLEPAPSCFHRLALG